MADLEPSDVIVELEFVTSLLADPSQFPMIADIDPAMLQDSNLRAVYAAFHAAKGRVTQSTVYDDLMRTAEGRSALDSISVDLACYGDPKAAIDQLFQQGVTAGAAEIVAERIRNAAIVRWTKQAVAQAKPDNFRDASEFAIALASQITNIASRAAPNANRASLADGADEEFANWLWSQSNPHKIDGVRVNLGDYDEEMGGLKPGELVMIGGHSGEGKTQLMCHMAMEAALSVRDGTGDHPKVAFFSLEMSRRQIASRWMSKLAGVSMNEKLITDEHRRNIQKAHQTLKELSEQRRLILVEPHAAHTIEQIARTLINLKQNDGIDVAFIDYAQLIRSSGMSTSKYDQLGEISQRLKLLTDQLQITIVMGVQLNRDALTKSGAGQPLLHHIADSMDLVRSADTVHMIWVPARHLTGANVGLWNGIAVLTTPKRRNGPPPGWMLYAYYPDRTTFTPVNPSTRRELLSDANLDIVRRAKPISGDGKTA